MFVFFFFLQHLCGHEKEAAEGRVSQVCGVVGSCETNPDKTFFIQISDTCTYVADTTAVKSFRVQFFQIWPVFTKVDNKNRIIRLVVLGRGGGCPGMLLRWFSADPSSG